MSNPNIEIVQADDSEFHARDFTDSQFYIRGTLVSGYLRFEVVAELTTGDRGTVRGNEFFEAMMQHFGNSVTAIEGDWSDMDPGLTANLDEFNRQTAAGTSLEDAARRTWTGQMAIGRGYASITVEHALRKDAVGQFQYVFDRFRSP